MRVLLFSLFLGVAMLAPSSCSAPADETWVRITSVSKADGSGSVAISVLNSDLNDGQTELVDITVENGTLIVGDDSRDVGVLVTVYHASVEYEFGGVALPSYAYPVTLVIPPPAGGEAGSTTPETLKNFPVVPATLKSWLLVPDNLPPGTTEGSFSVVATITLRARSEEGRELETSTSLTVVFN